MKTVADTGGLGVVVVEDEELFRDLLRIALSKQPGLTVLDTFADSRSALGGIPKLGPKVALMDIELGDGMNGFQLGLELRKEMPDLGIVLLSQHEEPGFIASLPKNAAHGWSYLLKKSVSDVDTLVRAINSTAAGLIVLDPALTAGLQREARGPLAKLTGRQREVLGLIALGLSNSEIARRLGLTEKSVQNQINQLYQQLHIEHGDGVVHARVQAVLTYLRAS